MGHHGAKSPLWTGVTGARKSLPCSGDPDLGWLICFDFFFFFFLVFWHLKLGMSLVFEEKKNSHVVGRAVLEDL